MLDNILENALTVEDVARIETSKGRPMSGRRVRTLIRNGQISRVKKIRGCWFIAQDYEIIGGKRGPKPSKGGTI